MLPVTRESNPNNLVDSKMGSSSKAFSAHTTAKYGHADNKKRPDVDCLYQYVYSWPPVTHVMFDFRWLTHEGAYFRFIKTTLRNLALASGRYNPEDFRYQANDPPRDYTVSTARHTAGWKSTSNLGIGSMNVVRSAWRPMTCTSSDLGTAMGNSTGLKVKSKVHTYCT